MMLHNIIDNFQENKKYFFIKSPEHGLAATLNFYVLGLFFLACFCTAPEVLNAREAGVLKSVFVHQPLHAGRDSMAHYLIIIKEFKKHVLVIFRVRNYSVNC
eukprot:GHVL01001419.1.p1 GENE.GHVL01001419.1~~GHVL01001419.1.p1  ORF type:complete len:102 (-),score=3.58 GHVL01001419.1:134-439(-)